MPIEFRCPGCQKLLRVPDESAGAKARCPQCSVIANVPVPGPAGSGPQQEPLDGPPSDGSNPFNEGSPAFPSAAKPTGSDPLNPYSSPASTYEPTLTTPSLSGEMVPTAVDAGSVINYAWQIWKTNLGFLVGITIVVIGISIGFETMQSGIVAGFKQQGNEKLGTIVAGAVGIFGDLIQMYIGIGQAQIVLKLLRGQKPEFGELFGGGPLFLPVLGASILAGVAMMVGFIACIVPGILLILFFWPFYFLIVDRKATVIESFGKALPFGKANVGTTFVLGLASAGIILAGLLAFCVGIVVAAPLVSLIWATAYLMMTGQLQARPKY